MSVTYLASEHFAQRFILTRPESIFFTQAE